MAENLPIAHLLDNLRVTSEQIFSQDSTSRETVRAGLQHLGYEGGDEDNPERNGEDNSKRIWKVLLRAVNNSVHAVTYVNLADPNIEQTERRLKLLCETENLRNYVTFENCTPGVLSQLGSPRDIADTNILGIKKNAPIRFVTKLIEQQFSIQWNTRSVNGVREPREFNFYEFCDVERLPRSRQNEQMKGKTKHLQYEPRSAHVKVQLDKFCRARPRIEYTKNQLCPPVYIRSRRNWTKWNPVRETFTPVEHSHFNRMSKLITKYISSHAIKITTDHQQVLTKHTLYWAVVRDNDFRSGNYLKLKSIGNTQVYVGKAKNGIKGRWLTDGDNHCKMMKRCLDNVQAMTTYDPSRLKGIQLVEARLLLAKLREEECALFVMNTYEGPQASENLKADETAQINGNLPQNGKKTIELLEKCSDWKPKYMAYGMNKG